MKKAVFRILQIILIVIIIVCLWHIVTWYLNNKHIEKSMEELEKAANIKEENIEIDYEIQLKGLNVDFDELISRNQDAIAWIKVNGTNINYPVVQTTDNSFYLNHSFDQSVNSAGWVFGDYRNNFTTLDRNNVIYAHSRLNGSMFATLKNALTEEWYECKENHYVILATPSQNMIWKVFSVYTIPTEEYYISTYFSSDEQYINFLNTIKNRSVYDFKVDLGKDDKILTLSTCNNLNNNGRIVLHAKLLQTY